jgi:hypothetical protein
MLQLGASSLRPSDYNTHPRVYSYDLRIHPLVRTDEPITRISDVAHRDICEIQELASYSHVLSVELTYLGRTTCGASIIHRQANAQNA